MKKLTAVLMGLSLMVSLGGCTNYQPEKRSDGRVSGIQPMDISKVEPFSYGPVLARIDVISGKPEFRIWQFEKDGDIKTGIWESTPGKWHFRNAENHWEYCRIIEGESIITEDGGEPHHVKAGDSFILHEGFSGTWEAVKTTRKDYVIRTRR